MKPQWKDSALIGSSDITEMSIPFLHLLLGQFGFKEKSRVLNQGRSFPYIPIHNFGLVEKPRVALSLLSAPSMDLIH